MIKLRGAVGPPLGQAIAFLLEIFTKKTCFGSIFRWLQHHTPTIVPLIHGHYYVSGPPFENKHYCTITNYNIF